MKLKTKILFGLAILLSSALSLNLFYSYKIISADKKTYIFENSLNQVEKLSNDLVGRIQTTIQNANTYYYLAINAPSQLQNVLDDQDFIAGFSYHQNSQSQVFVHQLNPEATEIRSVLRTRDSTDRVLSKLSIGDINYLRLNIADNQIELSFLLDLSLVDNLFSKFGIFHSLLVVNDEILLGQSQSAHLLNSVLTRQEEKASFEFQDEHYGAILVSQAKFPQLNLVIVSFAMLDDAFAFLTELLLNALYFGLIILGVSLIIGLIFSFQVTRPIQVLTGMAQAIATGDYSQRSSIQTGDEIKILGDSFNQMSSEISGLLEQKEVMIKKLEDYGQNLEKMVDERTEQLRSANNFIEAMINSLDQGLFVIDKDLKCLPTYTRACETLFHKTPSELTFDQLLDLSSKEGATLSKWAEILFSEKIPFDSAKGLGPKEKIYEMDDNFKHISLNYFPMRNQENLIDNVVVVATDKTNEVKAIRQFEEKSAYVDMILKLIRLKTQFLKFMTTAEKMLEDLSEIISLDPIDLDKCMFIYHSLNGGFGSFSLRDLQQRARKSEQLIVDWRESDKPLEEIGPVIREDFHQFCELFESQKLEILSIFGDKSSVIELEVKLVKQLEDAVESRDAELVEQVFTDLFKRAPVHEYFSGYAEMIETISQKISKPMSPLDIVFGELRVSRVYYEEFFSVLVHLFRNSMDHGIETTQLRREREKPIEGTIRVICELTRKSDRDYFILQITDDGGGIDPELIKKVWNSKYPDQPLDQHSDQEVIMKIFDPNFSTSEKLTDLSGRGVGMSSVKDVVEKLQGTIEVESVVGRGTSFKFILPYY